MNEMTFKAVKFGDVMKFLAFIDETEFDGIIEVEGNVKLEDDQQ